MPAPPPESEPAMVTAIAVIVRSDAWRELSACRPRAGGDPYPPPVPSESSLATRAMTRRMGPRLRGDDNKWLGDASLFASLTLPLRERLVDDRPQLARRVGRALGERKRGDHRNAVGAGRDGGRRIARIDARDGTDRQLRAAPAQHLRDAREAIDANRRIRIVLGGRDIDAADRRVVEEIDRRGFRLLDRLDREPDDGAGPKQAARI